MRNSGLSSHSIAVSVPIEALSWKPPSNGERLQLGDVFDPTIDTLLDQLENDQWVSVSRPGSYSRFLIGMLGQAQTAVSGYFLESQPAKPTVAEAPPAPRGSAEALLRLVEKWLAEDDGYDAAAWPVIQKDIEENRLSGRSRFHG